MGSTESDGIILCVWRLFGSRLLTKAVIEFVSFLAAGMAKLVFQSNLELTIVVQGKYRHGKDGIIQMISVLRT